MGNEGDCGRVAEQGGTSGVPRAEEMENIEHKRDGWKNTKCFTVEKIIRRFKYIQESEDGRVGSKESKLKVDVGEII